MGILIFRSKSGCDKVIVLWTANTERFCEVAEGLNDTPENLMASIKSNEAEVSPSTLFAVASILEGVSDQNVCENTNSDNPPNGPAVVKWLNQ